MFVECVHFEGSLTLLSDSSFFSRPWGGQVRSGIFQKGDILERRPKEDPGLEGEAKAGGLGRGVGHEEPDEGPPAQANLNGLHLMNFENVPNA